MYAVNVEGVSKSYGRKTVVDRVSFQVAAGEILGLIGPNGAGKTTCIRMIMDVIKPDSGQVVIFERLFRDEIKNEIGYLPEERGLYRKKPIIESMVYLAALKGMDREQARSRAEEWLSRVNMQAHKNKKIEELSHGMAQIIQFLVTILHGPRIIILDEPFTGLDPVNIKMVKDIILEQKQQGKAIILSTHRMNEVEELCDRVFMINRGQNVLYGSIEEVKAKYRNNSVVVNFEGELGELSGILVKRVNGHSAEITLGENTTRQQLLERLVSSKVMLNKFEASTPSLNEIFIRVAGGQK
ncbi:MAG TPA: ATP-binding cassette domain-containing protein, partial [Dehalococcoidales bacterium]